MTDTQTPKTAEEREANRQARFRALEIAQNSGARSGASNDAASLIAEAEKLLKYVNGGAKRER